jgi:hypothetical protein
MIFCLSGEKELGKYAVLTHDMQTSFGLARTAEKSDFFDVWDSFFFALPESIVNVFRETSQRVYKMPHPVTSFFMKFQPMPSGIAGCELSHFGVVHKECHIVTLRKLRI